MQARREHSVREIKAKLTQKGHEPSAVTEALEFAKRHDLQNDMRYAKSQARTLAGRKGDRVVSSRLKAQGIDRETQAVALEQLAPEQERALRLLARFEGQPVDAALRSKAWRFLLGRGFSGRAIESAWRVFTGKEDFSG